MLTSIHIMKIAMRPLMLAAALMLLMSCFAANANAETDLDPDLGEGTGRFLFPFKKTDKVNQSGPGDNGDSTNCAIADECQCNSNAACSVKQLTEFCTKCVDNPLKIDDRFKGKVVFKKLEVVDQYIEARDTTLATEVFFPKLVKTDQVKLESPVDVRFGKADVDFD